MKWPRGRYNKKKIIGFSVKLSVQLGIWCWLPRRIQYCNWIRWGWFVISWDAVYAFGSDDDSSGTTTQ